MRCRHCISICIEFLVVRYKANISTGSRSIACRMPTAVRRRIFGVRRRTNASRGSTCATASTTAGTTRMKGTAMSQVLVTLRSAAKRAKY